MATAYAEGMTRRQMVEAYRKMAIAKASVSMEESKPVLIRENAGINLAALERFRKKPMKKGVRMGSVTTSEDGVFSDNEED